MTSATILCVAFGIGVIAGLRSMTAPAVTSWAARLGWINLQGSHLAFMGSLPALWVLSLLAVAELVNDKLPKTPSRTAPGPLIARLVLGGLAAATLTAGAASGGVSIVAGALLGAVGAVAGAFGGYQVRSRLVRALGVPDFVIALLEDVVAVGGGFLLASRF
jgi:uncharacterized membrane protein